MQSITIGIVGLIAIVGGIVFIHTDRNATNLVENLTMCFFLIFIALNFIAPGIYLFCNTPAFVIDTLNCK